MRRSIQTIVKNRVALDKYQSELCEKLFKNNNELMLHKKREHAESVSDCWNFNAGVCEWDKNCWFLHSEEKIKTDFKCIVCDENFQTKMICMDHRKRNHQNLTSKCKNISNGSCDYGVICWFRHNEEKKNSEENHENEYHSNNNNSVMQRILKLMEEMTKKMTQNENRK